MKPAQFDLKVTRKDDYVLPMNLRGRNAQGNKTVLDMTGFTAESALLYKDGTVAIVTVNWLNQAQGELELVISRSVTTVLPDTGTKWFFALTNPAGRKFTYLDGDVFPRDRGAKTR